MFLEFDVQIWVRALLEAGKTPTEISRQLGISRPTVYKIKATGIEKMFRSQELEREEFGEVGEAVANPCNEGKASPRCQTLINNLKSATAGRVPPPPQSTDANPLNHAFWPHIESKVCKLRHPNIAALKAAVNQEWAGMDRDFVVKSSKLSGSASWPSWPKTAGTSNEKI
ncbi:Uncharacterized protein FKW44_020241 [Caligus rogercresseyi]|uniref:Resolvase HTH domain-containing protein n=1 Tax=Caligus rogercresseyi TaxID=217165 RepID=A0A7T8GX06_CALRO|nr:Uncharacterized protein FKW44_020241 [Caligus rogercresseyi]